MKKLTILDEDWTLLTSFFPPSWKQLAKCSGALARLRGFKSEHVLMRTLLLHIARGYSLRETVVRAKAAGFADVSDVALLKRLRSSEAWFRELCVLLLKEKQLEIPSLKKGIVVRLLDATVVKEPGKTGSQWRIHYCLQLPELQCDYFELTPTHGDGVGESFARLPVSPQDYVMGDRGYSTPPGVAHLHKKGAYVLVRVNSIALPLMTRRKRPFGLLEHLKSLRVQGRAMEWEVLVAGPNETFIPGRLCAIRKTEQAIKLDQKRRLRIASKKGTALKPETMEFAKYVVVFTTFPKSEFSTSEVMEWYRVRWQIELVFKRFKSIAHLGHLPKYDDSSSKAWLFGKLFVSLLTQKLIRYARDFSPWGYLQEPSLHAPPNGMA